MDAIARHFGVHSLKVNSVVKSMNAGKESDVAMQNLVPSFTTEPVVAGTGSMTSFPMVAQRVVGCIE